MWSVTLLIILCYIYDFVTGQNITGPEYECTEGHCSSDTGYERVDVMGCLDFCHTDEYNTSMTLSRDEYHYLHELCLGFSNQAEPICDEQAMTDFVLSYMSVCLTETHTMFLVLSAIDGDTSSVSLEDTNLAYDFISAMAGDPIQREGYREYYHQSYPLWEDPECTVPYP